jgi:hypothetical protein
LTTRLSQMAPLRTRPLAKGTPRTAKREEGQS